MADDTRDRDRSVAKRVVRATTGVTNIVVVGTAAVGAAALQSWSILALGGVAYGALVAWDLVSGKSGRSRGSGQPAGLDEDLSAFTDPRTRTSVRTIVAAKREIERVMNETSAEVQAQLVMAIASVTELEERAAGLARRARTSRST